MRSRAFTLIELLVVVAIIALLISILLPALSRARESGKATVCLSNVRSMMLAVSIYADSHSGKFPGVGLSHSGGSGDVLEQSWIQQLIAEYGNNAEVLRCPNDESLYWTESTSGAVGGAWRRTSYASNDYLALPIGNRPPYDRMEAIRRPSTTVFWVELAEEGEYATTDHVHAENWWFSSPRELASEQMELSQHTGQSNYGLLDGHAQRMRFEETYEITPGSGFPPTFLTNKYDPDIGL